MLVHFRTKGIPGRYGPGSFTTDGIREIIRNPYHAGLVAQYPTAQLDMSDDDRLGATNLEATEPKVKDQRIAQRLVPGQHTAIISPALWQSNQQERRNRNHTPNSANRLRRAYMLAGVGRCWECWAERGADSTLYGTTGSGNATQLYLCAWMKSCYKAKSRTDAPPEIALPTAQPVAEPACRHPATRRADALESATTQLISRRRIPG
jgi:hypothetical protein